MHFHSFSLILILRMKMLYTRTGLLFQDRRDGLLPMLWLCRTEDIGNLPVAMVMVGQSRCMRLVHQNEI